jgi:alkaline phosphatase D
MDSARRGFLCQASRLALLAAAGSAIAREPGKAYPFSLGVASGSPMPNAVILWTRILADPLDAAPPSPLAITVRWEVAEDEGFKRIAAKGSATALPALAHSVHVDATGLQPARWYWYRFMLGDAVSPIGRTRTAPAANAMPSMLKMAVASCQHWEFGAYGAHRHIARAAPDLVAFLGDYIYEWGPFRLNHPESATGGDECFDLALYRRRYAQYKSDPDLQAAHHAAPWVVTWDDHEVANDYGGLRDERLAEDFAARRAAAYQAFYEHMPLRLPPQRSFASVQIYQRYDWGRLARIHLLDDRQYRAVQACSPEGRGGSSSASKRDCAELLDPTRSMLGWMQEAWLDQGLRSSGANWNIIAQQTLMAGSSSAKLPDPAALRYWTDGWDGYPVARRRLLDSLRNSGAKGPLVLSGDVHTFYAADLLADIDQPVSSTNPVIATEFCAGSVTSSSGPQARTDARIANNPHLKYGRSDRRGFTLLEISPDKTVTHMIALDDVDRADTPAFGLADFQVEANRPGPMRV